MYPLELEVAWTMLVHLLQVLLVLVPMLLVLETIAARLKVAVVMQVERMVLETTVSVLGITVVRRPLHVGALRMKLLLFLVYWYQIMNVTVLIMFANFVGVVQSIQELLKRQVVVVLQMGTFRTQALISNVFRHKR